MSDQTKYEGLLNDLKNIESRVLVFKDRVTGLTNRNVELKEEIYKLKKENSELNLKIRELESELKDSKKSIEDFDLNSLNLEEKENLKLKIKELIDRIDYHLSADSIG